MAAHSTDPSVGAGLKRTVSTRLDQTQPSASGSSHDVRGTRDFCGKWKMHATDDGGAWEGDWKNPSSDWNWALSDKEKASKWEVTETENPQTQEVESEGVTIPGVRRNGGRTQERA